MSRAQLNAIVHVSTSVSSGRRTVRFAGKSEKDIRLRRDNGAANASPSSVTPPSLQVSYRSTNEYVLLDDLRDQSGKKSLSLA